MGCKRKDKKVNIKGHDQRDNSEFKWKIHLLSTEQSKLVYLLLESILPNPKDFEKLQNGNLAIYSKKSKCGKSDRLRVIYLGEDKDGVDTIYSYIPQNDKFAIDPEDPGKNSNQHISFPKIIESNEEEKEEKEKRQKQATEEFTAFKTYLTGLQPYYSREFDDKGKQIGTPSSNRFERMIENALKKRYEPSKP